MARPIRIEFEEACYHVMARANERKSIFREESDYQLFLQTLKEAVNRFGIEVYVYCLMPNHYHLAIGTPRGNLSQAIGWLQTTFTVRYNRKHKRSGHLFQGRFKAHLVEADAYAQELMCYIHLNPVRTKDKKKRIESGRKMELDHFAWSSHRYYKGVVSKPDFLSDRWRSYWGKSERSARQSYWKKMELYFEEGIKNPWEELKQGLVLGSEKFWERCQKPLQSKGGIEEEKLKTRIGKDALAERIRKMIKGEEKKYQIWIRVKLGGEKMVGVGKNMGYKNGSGVLEVVKRLERKRNENKEIDKKLKQLEIKMWRIES